MTEGMKMVWKDWFSNYRNMVIFDINRVVNTSHDQQTNSSIKGTRARSVKMDRI